jgi:TPP-dependent pyruvate/acetoin dehydrogenase alpha subunit
MTAKRNAPGKAAASKTPTAKGGFTLISREKLNDLYAAMVKCRMLAKRASLMVQQHGLDCGLDGTARREAVAAGVAGNLQPDDALSPAAGDVMASFLKGVPLDKLLGKRKAAVNGRARRDGGYAPLNILPPSSTMAAQLNIACGVALAGKMKKDGQITVAFCEGGADSLDSWREALIFAGIHQLPMLFIWQRDMCATPKKLEPRSGLAEIGTKTQACGVPAITVDANDVVAIYRVAYESVARARQGRGPTLIECRTFRSHSRSGSITAKAGQLEGQDPIQHMESYLKRKGLFDEKLKRRVAARFRLELNAVTKPLGN